LLRKENMSVKSTDLLAKNLHLFKKMNDLAARQNALLSEGHMGMFFNLANQREQIQHEIGANEKRDRGLSPRPLDEAMREKTHALSREIADVIRSIQDVDEKTEEFFLRERDALFSEIRDLRKGQRAMRGYGGKSPRGAKFIDWHG
jgi:hypothetical protein